MARGFRFAPARQIEFGIFKLGLGGFELGYAVFHVWYTQGQFAVSLGGFVAGFEEFPLAGGDVALPLFEPEQELGFGQRRLFLCERQLVVYRVDLQHEFAFFEGAAVDEFRGNLDNLAGHAGTQRDLKRRGNCAGCPERYGLHPGLERHGLDGEGDALLRLLFRLLRGFNEGAADHEGNQNDQDGNDDFDGFFQQAHGCSSLSKEGVSSSSVQLPPSAR